MFTNASYRPLVIQPSKFESTEIDFWNTGQSSPVGGTSSLKDICYKFVYCKCLCNPEVFNFQLQLMMLCIFMYMIKIIKTLIQSTNIVCLSAKYCTFVQIAGNRLSKDFTLLKCKYCCHLDFVAILLKPSFQGRLELLSLGRLGG